MPSQQEGWRGTRSWEGTQPGQLTQTGQRDIPYLVMSCLVYKQGGSWPGETDHCSVSNCIVHRLICIFQFFYYYYCHFIIVVIIIIIFFLFCPIKLSLSQPRSFTFFPLILSPIPLGGGKWLSGCVVLSCWLGLNHDTRQQHNLIRTT